MPTVTPLRFHGLFTFAGDDRSIAHSGVADREGIDLWTVRGGPVTDTVRAWQQHSAAIIPYLESRVILFARTTLSRNDRRHLDGSLARPLTRRE